MLTFYSFLTEALGGYTYKVPKDVRKQLFDFYIWTTFYNRKALVGKENLFDDDTIANINAIVPEATVKIVNAQKDVLLKAGLSSLCQEMRWAGWPKTTKDLAQAHHIEGEDPERILSLPSSIPEKKLKKYYQWSDTYYPTYGKMTLTKSPYISQLKKCGISPSAFVNLAIMAFKKLKWSTIFGGPKWVPIAEAWLDLNRATHIDKQILAIDHMYDLQHNRGFVLDKVKEFQKTWIQKALDFKRSKPLVDVAKQSFIPNHVFSLIANYYGLN